MVLTTFPAVNNYGKSDHTNPDHQTFEYHPPSQDQYHQDDPHRLDELPGAGEDTFVDGDQYHVEVGFHGYDGFGVDFVEAGEEGGEYGRV